MALRVVWLLESRAELMQLLWLILRVLVKWQRSRKQEIKEETEPGVEAVADASSVKGAASKKQKQEKQQRSRKDKPTQHTFSHPLLAASLKGHSGNVTCFDFSSNGKYLASCADDRTVRIWSTKDFLDREHKCLRANVELDHALLVRFSPDSRFVASCGFTPDVKVWEVCFGKGGEFREVARAFDLKGHSAGVHSFAFSNDSHRMVTVSKDGTWKLWNTDVEYKKQQDPYLLKTVPCTSSDGSRIALSPDGRVVAISSGCNVAMYDATSGKLEEELQGVHSEEITDLRFDINGRFLVSSGDKAIRVFHNAPGYRAAIRDMNDMLKKAQNEAMKQRLQQQIKEAQSALDLALAAPAN
ncbi:hypothetical protein OJAV_G00144200 [Oryzias javanicus]|uniref:Uncharacterized protein n=1 Tax=Oryzias javanicus TaxID=123683 RepID=A0A437CN60_ORYJA|nr:hypothetical protein OJAV_G00144200 [Oryzias javanicus]